MQQKADHIDCLDGLRGIAALWVLLGHAALLTGFRVPIIDHPDLGVDLFILLSGFLMAFHYVLRAEREPWGQRATWVKFWIRRYFRIAPLYYVALTAALLLGPVIFEARSEIAALLPGQAQAPERYLDASALNALLHATFLFGLLPDYAFRTALPDWSIGLEMQFYAAFPFLMLWVRRVGWPAGAISICLVAAVVGFAANRALHFPMPSFLPMKLHVFMAGMLIAGALHANRRRAAAMVGIAVALTLIPVGGAHAAFDLLVRFVIVAGFASLILHRHLAGPIASIFARLAMMLSRKPFRVMGEISFGVYLWHLLVMIPLAAWVFRTFGADLSAGQRFLLVLAVTVPIVFTIAALTYRFVEQRGQRLGKSLVGSFATASG